MQHRRWSGHRKHQPRTRRDRCDVWCGRKHHLWASTGLVMESWSQLLGLLGLFLPSGYTEIRSRPSGPNRPNLDQKWAKACGKTNLTRLKDHVHALVGAQGPPGPIRWYANFPTWGFEPTQVMRAGPGWAKCTKSLLCDLVGPPFSNSSPWAPRPTHQVGYGDP